ncbi:hypothetical protein, partial [uncultured Duncaniella sp.]|uniref:hypothetical protein n=1 Tax=uncultured Duncaniella sp. TaxID=2768039 RepID=UPI0025B6C872
RNKREKVEKCGRVPVFPQPKRTKVGLIKTNHGLSTSSVVFLCPDANNAGRTKAHENGIPDIYLLQMYLSPR